ncbi:MAG: DegT/DnrJ/EryC1/StrS family aminotransferase [Magnetospirillum sp.]|nr:DegT/DnrJ/EryC1/StrS family aminotransferase [Magnetospirillum sp.]
MRRPIPLFRTFMPEGMDLAPVLTSGYLVAGTQVAAFEAALGTWLGNPRVCATNSSSAALTLALRLAGVGPGDQVAVSPLACTATTMPIATLGATPLWCDVDPATGMIDPADCARRLTGRTKAILSYHWAGDVGAVEALAALAAKHRIACIEDASEALGAELAGKRLGAGSADFTVVSFHAAKPLTTGEGGALLCARAADHERALRLRRFGIDNASFRLPTGDLNPASDIVEAGWNAYLTNIPAAIGLAGLPHVDGLLARARANGAWYDSALAEVAGLRLIRRRGDARSAFWAYTILAERADTLLAKLADAGIGCQRLHLRNDAYSCFGGRLEDLPGVAAFAAAELVIPCGWWVGDLDRDHIAATIREGW